MKPKTCKEALELWDAGRPIWSVEMGGIGPGYEQCIHIMAMEMLRKILDQCGEEITKLQEQGTEEQWDDFFSAHEKLFDYDDSSQGYLGASGAQYGAARNICSVMIRHGWEKGLEMADKERHILISKDFPTVAQQGS
jgi:hypothetical protein